MRRVWFVLIVTLSASAAWGAGAPAATGHRAAPDRPAAAPRVTIAAAGDTMLGDTPSLPPRPATYLSAVRSSLAADITFGNLEGTLTTATHSKCGSGSSDCFAFRDPPSYGRYLHRAGFDVMNSANNHSHDFGDAGVQQTTRALHAHGIAQDGLPGEIAYVRRNGVKVAFVGFAPYPNTSDLLDYRTAARMIHRAGARADVVVVYMHAGAEGADKDHVTRREEYAFGEDRGNPFRFAHMAVDDGADLVIASGPHVERGMQWYHRRLIAYSMGNFANYHNFGSGGVLSYSCVLRVTLSATGGFVKARFVSVILDSAGHATVDSRKRSAAFVNRLSREDFGDHAAHILSDGEVARSVPVRS